MKEKKVSIFLLLLKSSHHQFEPSNVGNPSRVRSVLFISSNQDKVSFIIQTISTTKKIYQFQSSDTNSCFTQSSYLIQIPHTFITNDSCLYSIYNLTQAINNTHISNFTQINRNIFTFHNIKHHKLN